MCIFRGWDAKSWVIVTAISSYSIQLRSMCGMLIDSWQKQNYFLKLKQSGGVLWNGVHNYTTGFLLHHVNITWQVHFWDPLYLGKAIYLRSIIFSIGAIQTALHAADSWTLLHTQASLCQEVCSDHNRSSLHILGGNKYSSLVPEFIAFFVSCN